MTGISSNYTIGSPSTEYRYLYSNNSSQTNELAPPEPLRHPGKSYVNSDALQYLQSIRMNAASLRDSLNEVTQLSTFNQMAAAASAAAVRVETTDEVSSLQEDTVVEVEQVAEPQANQGAALEGSSPFASVGHHQFELSGGGQRQMLSIEALEGDTNRDVQHRIVQAVNRSAADVQAHLVSDADGAGALRLESTRTGQESAFTIRDVSGSAVADTGIDRVVHEARDAVFTVNGQQHISPISTVDLENGMHITLQEATDAPVTLSAGRDTAFAAAKVQELVDGYNALLSAAKSGATGNAQLQEELTAAYRAYAPALEGIGIVRGEDDSLRIEPGAFAAAHASGALEQQFTQTRGVSFGFANRLTNIVNRVEGDPAYYVDDSAPILELADEGSYEYEKDMLSIFMDSRSINGRIFQQLYSLGYLFDIFV